MKHWYNNGIIDKMYDENTQPNGWVLGRLRGINKATLGKHWYNNGVEQGNFFEGMQPEGWVAGSLSKSNKGYKIYNNGEINKSFPSNSIIPEGWTLGRLPSTNTNYSKASYNKKLIYWNNGINTIKLNINDTPPDGYIFEGKLLKSNKIERDLYFKSKGYIPLKNLLREYGHGWYNNIKNLDKVIFKDPYIYINEAELPRIIEYASKQHGKGTSNFEFEIYEYIKSIYSGKIIRNARSILKDGNTFYELDIFIPELNIAIEANGIFWHSSFNIDKNYHVNKTNIANKLGIRLIHIFEDLWYSKTDICKSIIRSSLGLNKTIIYARKCIIKNVPKDDEKLFLNINHIQGYIPSSKCIGLYYNDNLVQLISFRKSRFKINELELARQCTLLNTTVVGGFSKLMKNSNVYECISYIDRSLSFNSKKTYCFSYRMNLF